ncbi:MAG: HEAT repeat domain-containing protein [Haloarculaceae archaeon]
MSNGDDEPEESVELDTDTLGSRLDDAAETLEAAETEADLDEVEAALDGIAEDIEAAEFPEPDEDEDEPAPGEELESQLSDLRSDLAEQRGPYAEDVVETVEGAESTLSGTRWTESGESDALEATEQFLDVARDVLDVSLAEEYEDAEGAAETLASVRGDIGDAAFDPDEDADTIGTLLDAAGELEAGLDAAEEWDDLTVREQLDAQGFYDVLESENRKDFPAEWNAVKVYEKMKEPDPILTALERFESDFMEENVLDALEHIAPAEAFDAMHERAQKRDKQPIRILGRIGDDRACETLHEFLGGGDVTLEKTTLRALGAIGSEESTQPVANRLVADVPEIRSVAARALGLIGDTRAIDPLADVLETDDADEVRASAAWALNQIGTERALEAAAEYADDRSYIVQVEAEKAAGV